MSDAHPAPAPAIAPAMPPAPRRATVRFLFEHPAHIIALGGGSGLPRVAPGTFGTLWGWLAYLALQRWLSAAAIGGVILLALAGGWWACSVTARHLRLADPGCIVWDEVVAFWLVLWLVMPAGWLGQAVAFALFRFFDAVKPGPVGWADRLFKHSPAHSEGARWARAGFGILFDDLVAAFCTLLVIALWRTWSPT